MGKVRQRLGKAYIHTKEESIQSIIIDALVDHGYDVDVEVTAVSYTHLTLPTICSV